MSTPVEQLAILLQDAKTLMEKNDLSAKPRGTLLPDGMPALDEIYRTIASTIYDLEERAGVDAPALRDARDAKVAESSTPWSVHGSPLCQCADPGCPHCGGECDLLPMYHLLRVDTGVLPSAQAKVQMCEDCGEDALESGPFALDHTVGCDE